MDAEQIVILITTSLLVLSALRDWLKERREAHDQKRTDLQEDYARVKQERDECHEQVKSLEATRDELNLLLEELRKQKRAKKR